MNNHFQQLLLQTTGGTAITSQQVIQTLWSGYGEIVRVGLSGAEQKSVILKYIVLPDEVSHPRGWNTNRSHARKIKSYDVEMHWYQQWAQQCNSQCRVPECHAASSNGNERIIILEDLNAAGFPVRHSSLNLQQAKVCLNWLANFHATFMNQQPEGLWEIGTYWHLETRPDEFEAMADGPLKQAAKKIDAMLNNCRYQTFVHGDAKVENFCFTADDSAVAAVDFQYVGGGCGIKDVAYFLGSCLSEHQCERWQDELLDYYFKQLRQSLNNHKKSINPDEVETEWRLLYPIAWTDFYRFLAGWMPTHHKITPYTKRLSDIVLKSIIQ